MGLLDSGDEIRAARSLLGPYLGHPNIERSKGGTDRFSGPALALLSGLLGTAPDEQGGSVLDPNSARMSPNASLAGFGIGSLLQLAPLLSTLKPGAISNTFGRASVKIRDPQPVPQRPYSNDYKAIPSSDEIGKPLSVDIEGRTLTAPYIAGRRVVGGVDEALLPIDSKRIAGLLDAEVRTAPRNGPDLKRDAGRYYRDGRKIFLDESMDGAASGSVLQHEVGHMLEDISGYTRGVSTAGLQKELAHNYDSLNNIHGSSATPRIPKKQWGPSMDGYAEKDWTPEKWAEAFRAYQINPNAFKGASPKTAARIREVVNTHPELNKVIQFNSVGAGLAGGLLGTPSED